MSVIKHEIEFQLGFVFFFFSFFSFFFLIFLLVGSSHLVLLLLVFSAGFTVPFSIPPTSIHIVLVIIIIKSIISSKTYRKDKSFKKVIHNHQRSFIPNSLPFLESFTNFFIFSISTISIEEKVESNRLS